MELNDKFILKKIPENPFFHKYTFFMSFLETTCISSFFRSKSNLIPKSSKLVHNIPDFMTTTNHEHIHIFIPMLIGILNKAYFRRKFYRVPLSMVTLKFHVHKNNPEEFFLKIKTSGPLLQKF